MTPSNLPVLSCVAVVLVLLSMIFSATESAFLSINKLRVRILKNKKNRAAERVWHLLKNRDVLINTLLVCNNIVNIALSSIFTVIAVGIFGSRGIGIATFAVTMLLLVFGEISPKTVATHHPEEIAFFFSGFILVLEKILAPLVFMFTGIARFFLRLMKVNEQQKTASYTEEEIKTFLDVGREAGVLEKNEQTMMNRVFKFTDLEARDIMIPRKSIKAIPETFTYSQIIESSERYRLSRFPVFRKDIDDIVGILYVKDMLKFKANPEDFVLKENLRPPLYILGSKKMSGIQQMLRENRQSLAVVIDEYSGTDGLLTTEDLVREIFGPVTDEFKPYARKVEVKIKNPANAEVDGLSRLIDLNEELGTSLESENCETLGGYISERIGEIPVEGDSIEVDGYKFIVTKTDENRVAKVRIREA